MNVSNGWQKNERILLYSTYELPVGHILEVKIVQWILRDIPLGRNIQTVRMAKNMTQKEVVEKLQLMGSQMSRSTLANIEAGRRNIKASDLKLLKILFDVDYAEFFKN